MNHDEREGYDDAPRPRRRPDERAIERRVEDEPTRRRDSLMERRLRAREEGYDDYDDDYDAPRPRARSGYAPAYRGSSGGGCATGVLYLLLTVVVLGVLALLFGQQLLSSAASAFLPSLPNVSEKIVEVIATPTPTVRDRGGTIQQIRNLNRLETKSFSVERVIEASVKRDNPLDLVLGDRLLLIASGTVVGGVDLSKLMPADVDISADGESITLRLPPSEIFAKALDGERTRVYDRQTGIFASQNKDLETQARQQAETEILNAACEGGIMQQSAAEAQRSMEQFLSLLDFSSVTVTSAAGPCTAAATVPTVGPAAPATTP